MMREREENCNILVERSSFSIHHRTPVWEHLADEGTLCMRVDICNEREHIPQWPPPTIKGAERIIWEGRGQHLGSEGLWEFSLLILPSYFPRWEEATRTRIPLSSHVGKMVTRTGVLHACV